MILEVGLRVRSARASSVEQGGVRAFDQRCAQDTRWLRRRSVASAVPLGTCAGSVDARLCRLSFLGHVLALSTLDCFGCHSWAALSKLSHAGTSKGEVCWITAAIWMSTCSGHGLAPCACSFGALVSHRGFAPWVFDWGSLHAHALLGHRFRAVGRELVP